MSQLLPGNQDSKKPVSSNEQMSAGANIAQTPAGAGLLGIDVGTSGIKAVVFDLNGKTIASSFQEYPLLTPKPQWAEQNPEDWWQATCLACQQLLAADGVSAERILGLSFSGQMHGSVFLDKDGSVVRPCILWCDARTGEECRIITEKAGRDNLHAWTSNPALAGFTAPKAIWLQRHEPENFDKVRTLLLPKDYVRFRFTGELSTEVSDNAGTLLFNVGTKKWAAELLKVLGIPEGWMPPIYESFEITGRVTEIASKQTGLKVGTPVVAGGADNPCGAIGTGVVSEGQMFSSIGSSGVVFAPCSGLKVDP
ncbi:MAG TPA: FGGY family carbohydrate kinase, partial [bacterium]|nr:FGGY family carbohydrate kinase [bacterium]